MTEPLRPTAPADRRRIKAATRRLVDLAGGVTSAEQITRVKAPALSKFGSVSDPQFMPVDVVADLEADIGSPVVTALLAGMQGYQLTSRAGRTHNRAPHALGLPCVAAILENAAAMANQMNESLADGQVDAAEARRICAIAEEAIRHLRGIQARANAAADGGGGDG
ncbi:hypothetical protein AY599_23600 [Leptolyngbya valderiana BDU 20041]|nr:hypothetical protein AY599_23600 [Leptolyngbya valderiana BDU 20041]